MNFISFSLVLLMLLASAGSLWLTSGGVVPAESRFVVEQPGVTIPASQLDDLVVHVARYGLQQDEALTGMLEPVALAADVASGEVRQRVAFLLAEAWPGDEGRALAGITLRYLQYQQKVVGLEARNDLSRAERLEATLALQKAVFGKQAAAMFAQRNQMMRAVLEATGDGR